MRRTWKLIVFVLAVYGPLAPALVLFMLVAAPLIPLTGWPGWLQALLLAIDVGAVLVAAAWLGPGAVAEVRAALDADRRR